MTIRELLAEHAMAGRTALVSAVLVVFGAAAGCSSTVSDEDINRGIDHPAQNAATISEARSIDLRDEISRLEDERDEIEVKKSDSLKAVAVYRAKAAAAWSDPSLSERQRPVQADQFNTLADENEAKAYRYGQISDACRSRIALLEAERHDWARRAQRYDSLTIPAPAEEKE